MFNQSSGGGSDAATHEGNHGGEHVGHAGHEHDTHAGEGAATEVSAAAAPAHDPHDQHRPAHHEGDGHP